MSSVMRGVWPLLLAIALLMVGNGLQGSLLGLRASYEGFDVGATGIVMSSYYGGFLLSSFVTIRLIQQVGHIRVFAAFASLASTTVLMHALLPMPWVWLFLRFITGFALAGLYVVAESWLNQASNNETRGKILSAYMVIIYGCMALGQIILTFSDPTSFTPFIIVSILVSLALVPVSLNRTAGPTIDWPKKVSIKQLFHSSPLGFMASLATGVAQGAFLSLGAVYAARIGLTTAEIGVLMSVALIAVVPVQIPLGWISDRVDRRWVIASIGVIVGITAFVAAFVGHGDFPILLLLFAIYGGFSAPLYSLAIAHTNDFLEHDEMLGASSKLVFLNGVGSIIGPAFISLAMSFGGDVAFFVFPGFVHILLAVYALWRMTRRKSVSEDNRGDYVHVAVRATPVATISAVEDTEDYVKETDRT